ncbi:ribosome-associated translation inhibitor RaiA [Candidatus Parcubacteria bacterium]|nr:MAG: ribosome-associated translation inhibitor RaiA [Candidatus Parcubacteria bacterium]
MKVIISTRNLSLTKALQDYIDKKINSLEHFIEASAKFNSQALARVEIEKMTQHHKKGDYFKASAILTLSSYRFRAESLGPDLYAAVDELKDELARQLKHDRGKKTAKYLRGARFFKHIVKFSPLAWFKNKKGHREREEGF